MLDLLAQAIASEPSTADIIRDAHNFYNDCWNSLLTSVSIAIVLILAMTGIIGMLLPYVIYRARKRHLAHVLGEITKARHAIEASERKAMDEILAAKKLFTENLRQTLAQTEHSQQEIRCEIHRLTANTLHSFGGMSAQNRMYLIAASFIWSAAQYRCVLNEPDDVIARTLVAAYNAFVQAQLGEAMSDREPLDAMQGLAAWFLEQKLGPQSRAALLNLVEHFNQFRKKYEHVQSERADKASK